MKRLLGKSPSELKDIVASYGQASYVAKQILNWLYVHKVKSIMDMKNLSLKFREELMKDYEVGVLDIYDCQQSVDGTKKYMFEVKTSLKQAKNIADNEDDDKLRRGFIEAVMIPEGDRKTLCVSSQVGCKMACKFCMTGRQGFNGNLSVADIISQIFSIEESDDITNIVFMGMGEPLDNYENVKAAIDVLCSDWGLAWSPKRITLSTIGMIPTLKKFLEETNCHLALSLHNPIPEQRGDFMPVQKLFPVDKVLDLLKSYDFRRQRRLSFEYTMFAGHNDTPAHAKALISLLSGFFCRVNLIRFHKIPDFPYESSADTVMEDFKSMLERAGIITTIRASRGEDIFAACGMLAAQEKNLRI